MFTGAGGFALKVGFKGWIFFPWFVLRCFTALCHHLVHFVLPSTACHWCQRCFGVGMWNPEHSGTIPTHVITAQDLQGSIPAFPGAEQMELYTEQLKPLSCDCRMRHKQWKKKNPNLRPSRRSNRRLKSTMQRSPTAC